MGSVPYTKDWSQNLLPFFIRFFNFLNHSLFSIIAERPPPPQVVQQELLMAAEERGEYF